MERVTEHNETISGNKRKLEEGESQENGEIRNNFIGPLGKGSPMRGKF